MYERIEAMGKLVKRSRLLQLPQELAGALYSKSLGEFNHKAAIFLKIAALLLCAKLGLNEIHHHVHMACSLPQYRGNFDTQSVSALQAEVVYVQRHPGSPGQCYPRPGGHHYDAVCGKNLSSGFSQSNYCGHKKQTARNSPRCLFSYFLRYWNVISPYICQIMLHIGDACLDSGMDLCGISVA